LISKFHKDSEYLLENRAKFCHLCVVRPIIKVLNYAIAKYQSTLKKGNEIVLTFHTNFVLSVK